MAVERNRMTPREKLEKEISVTIREAFQAGFKSESVTEFDNYDGFAEAEDTLQNYVIGRWVSVEERLPERRGFFGIKWDDNYSHAAFTHSWFDPAPYDKINYWFSVRSSHHITHWLDLDLPEVAG